MVEIFFFFACLKKKPPTAHELYSFSFFCFYEEVAIMKISRYPKSSTFNKILVGYGVKYRNRN